MRRKINKSLIASIAVITLLTGCGESSDESKNKEIKIIPESVTNNLEDKPSIAPKELQAKDNDKKIVVNNEVQSQKGIDYVLILVIVLAIIEGITIYYLLIHRKVFITGPSETKDLYDDVLDMFKQVKEDTSSDANVLGCKIEKIKPAINKCLKKQESQSKNLISAIKGSLDNQKGDIEEIKNQLNAIQSLDSEKSEKLRRYENGYDTKILNRFLADILKVYDQLRDNDTKMQKLLCNFKSKFNIEDDNKDAKRFANNAKDLFEDAFDHINNMFYNNSIFKYNIEVGKVYNRDGVTIVKIKEALETDDNYEKGSVVEVLKDGFYIETAENEQKQIRMTEVKTKK